VLRCGALLLEKHGVADAVEAQHDGDLRLHAQVGHALGGPQLQRVAVVVRCARRRYDAGKLAQHRCRARWQQHLHHVLGARGARVVRLADAPEDRGLDRGRRERLAVVARTVQARERLANRQRAVIIAAHGQQMHAAAPQEHAVLAHVGRESPVEHVARLNQQELPVRVRHTACAQTQREREQHTGTHRRHRHAQRMHAVPRDARRLAHACMTGPRKHARTHTHTHTHTHAHACTHAYTHIHTCTHTHTHTHTCTRMRSRSAPHGDLRKPLCQLTQQRHASPLVVHAVVEAHASREACAAAIDVDAETETLALPQVVATEQAERLDQHCTPHDQLRHRRHTLHVHHIRHSRIDVRIRVPRIIIVVVIFDAAAVATNTA
jgi:hypothetical protein